MVFPEPGGRMMRFQFLKEKSLAVMVVVGLWWDTVELRWMWVLRETVSMYPSDDNLTII